MPEQATCVTFQNGCKGIKRGKEDKRQEQEKGQEIGR